MLKQNPFGKINMWSHISKKGEEIINIQLENSDKINIKVDKEYTTAGRRFMCTLKFNSMEMFYDDIERFMGMGIYGRFIVVKHIDKTFSLKTYTDPRFFASNKPNAGTQAQAHVHTGAMLERGTSSYFFNN